MRVQTIGPVTHEMRSAAAVPPGERVTFEWEPVNATRLHHLEIDEPTCWAVDDVTIGAVRQVEAHSISGNLFMAMQAAGVRVGFDLIHVAMRVRLVVHNDSREPRAFVGRWLGEELR